MTRFYIEKEKIIQWLDKQKVINYELEPSPEFGFIVNVKGDVILSGEERDFILRNIPVKFGVVTGRFDCHENQLKDLDFSPSVVGGRFKCSWNKIKSLKNCPQEVGGDFICNHNQITTLEYCPSHIKGDFICSSNQLESLEFCPSIIGKNFSCSENKIQTLLYCPDIVNGMVNYAMNHPLGDYQEKYNFNFFKEESIRLKQILELQERLTNELSDIPQFQKKIKI